MVTAAPSFLLSAVMLCVQVERYAAKLRELETLFSDLGEGSGSGSTSGTQVDRTLRAANQLVADLQETADRLKGTGVVMLYLISLLSCSRMSYILTMS